MTTTVQSIPSIQRDKTGKLTSVYTGHITLWFSYQTLVAFRIGASPVYVIENSWGPTTGKHLNSIDSGAKANRLPASAFHAKYLELVSKPAPVRKGK